MTERDKQGRAKQVLWASPVIVGAGVGVRNVAKGIRTGELPNPKSWLTKPAAMKGSVARSHAIASGMVQAGRTTGADYLSQLDQMATNMSWMRLPKEIAPTAITEAMRASVLSRGKLSLEEANRLSRQVITSSVVGTPAQPGGFEMALGAVKKYGDPGIFYRQLQGVISGKRTPGVYFNRGELRDLMKQTTGKWIYTGKGRLSGAVGAEQAATVQRWLGAVPGETGWKATLRGVREYPQGIRMARLQFAHPEISGVAAFDVPLTEGWYRQGANLYATNRMLVANQPVNFAEYQIQQLTERFLPGVLKDAQAGEMTSRLLKNRTMKFNAELSRYMTWTPAVSHPGMDIINQLNQWTVGVPEMSPAALRASEISDPYAMMGGLWKQGYFPPKSANQLVSGKVWGGIDPRKFWAYGADKPFERLPMQHLRPFAPTEEALKLMTQKFGPGQAFRRDIPFLATDLGKQMAGAGYKAPQIAMAYAVPETAGEAILERQGLAAEEALMRRNLMEMYGSQTVITKKIGLQEAIATPEIQQWIQQAAAGKVSPLELERGQALGREAGTSRLVTASRMSDVTEELIGAEIQGGPANEAVLQVRQSFVPKEYVKVYPKMTYRARNNAVLNEIADRVGLVFLKENVDGYTFAGGLLKDRSLLKEQMASGLAEIAAARAPMVTDPRVAAEMQAYIAGGASWAGANLPDELSVLRKAQQWGIKGRALGLIGGLVPAAAGAGMIPEAEAARIYSEVGGKAALKSPFVLGLTTAWPGAFRGMQGAGQRGTMEPRGLMQLLAHDWPTSKGPAQELLASEIMRSMRSYGPELTELHRATQTMAGQAVGGFPAVPLAEVGKSVARSEGYMLDIGRPVEAFGGAKSIYVPGTEALRKMDYFRVAQGDVLATDLQLAYNVFADTAKKARGAAGSALAVESMEQAAKELNKAVISATGMAMFGRGGGSGIGGALRERMTGSVMAQLSSIDPAYGAIREGLAEASHLAGETMYRDLFAAATSREERREIARQWSTLLKGGEAPGALMRHPTFGPYSVQPISMRLSKHPLTRSEYFIRTPAQLKMAAQSEIGKIMVDISPNIGLGADFDDDFTILKAIGDKKTADATRELLASKTYAQEYRKFAAKTAVLGKLAKTQAAQGTVSFVDDIERIASGAAKLRVGKAEIGRVSAPFTEAKLALGKYDPRLLPEFNLIAGAMEQQILGGKHMKDVAKQNIAQSVSTALSNIHRTDAEMGELLKASETVFGPQLKKGIDISMAGQEWRFASDPKAMWGRVQGAMRSAHESELISTHRTLMRGHTWHADVTAGTMLKMVEEAQRGTKDTLNALALRGVVTPRGPAATMVSKARSRLNQITKEAGQIVKTWGKPALYGLAATAAAAMLMGGPKTQPLMPPPPSRPGDTREQLPTSQMLSRNMLRGITPMERDMRPESFTPPEGAHGRPSSPGMPTPSTYMTNQAPMKLRVMARAQGDYVPDRESIIETLQRAGYPVRGDVRVTINDNRSKMTKQRVSEILEGF